MMLLRWEDISTVVYIVAGVMAVVSAAMCEVLARKKGYGYGEGYAVVGLLLGPFGVLWVGLLPDLTTQNLLRDILKELQAASVPEGGAAVE